MPSRDLYRDIFENMHDGVYFVDRDRRITFRSDLPCLF
jgi:PAS domain-containing protein